MKPRTPDLSMFVPGRSAPASKCLEALARQPVPLVSDILDVAVLWSAKAGCTFAVKWLFFQEGILEEALGYSPWPHLYRQQVYCARPAYSDKVRRIPALGPRAVKFVRNPFDRAVSSYLSYCQAAHDRSHPGHMPVLASVGWFVGRAVDQGERFTFREWVGFLGTLDLDAADIHVRRQVGPCERLGLLPELRTLRIEESYELLPRLEDELGLRQSNLAGLRQSGHHTRREDVATFAGDTPFGPTRGVTVPGSPAFYDASLLQAVGELYREDIERYGYTGPGSAA
jgi:hypothetical protein